MPVMSMPPDSEPGLQLAYAAMRHAAVNRQDYGARRGRLPHVDPPQHALHCGKLGQPVLGKPHQAVMLRLMPISTSMVMSASEKSMLGVAAPWSQGKDTRSSASTSERSKWMPRARHSPR